MDEASTRSKMQKVLDLFMTDLSSVRTGRATSAVVTDLEIAVYGGQQKLTIQELANVSTPDAQTVVIEPWDKSIIGEIRKGIQAANIGANPAIDGEIIRISFPPLTTEDREKYSKLVSTKAESAKVMVRQVRGEELKNIQKGFEEKEITEDEKFNQEKRLQGITDEFVKEIEDTGDKKKKELMQL